jgi:hypothetical protein
MEIAAVSLIVAAALAFAGWRVVATVRVAKGEACGGCGSCKAPESPAGN